MAAMVGRSPRSWQVEQLFMKPGNPMENWFDADTPVGTAGGVGVALKFR